MSWGTKGGRIGLKSNQHRQTIDFDRGILIIGLIFLLAGGIVTRLFWLQVVRAGEYKELANGMHGIVKELEARRGEIFLKSVVNNKTVLRPIATSRNLYDVYAVPTEIENPEEAAEKVSELLGLDYEVLKERFSKVGDPYEPVIEKIDEDKSKQVTALGIKGIALTSQSARYYPDKELFGHITGFVGVKNDEKVGLYGIEQYFDKALSGEKGYSVAEKDAAGNPISVSGLTQKAAVDGASVVLTIDYQIQYTACDELKKAVEKYGATGGNVIVMEPKTGALLAMCNYPNFDPNEYGKVKDVGVFVNHAAVDVYEPGSIFKPLVMSSAIDRGILTQDSTYNDTGEVKIGKYTIRNSDEKGHGVQNMVGILEKSLNTGMVFVAQKVGAKTLKEYLEAYGFGQPVEIETPGEGKGDISSLSKKAETYLATASFGQGLTVTPLQMVQAFGVLANSGKMMKPYLVDEIKYDETRQTKTEPKMLKQVISANTAATIGGMLVDVVDRGYGNKAYMSGYYIAGKTGTAQVPNKNKSGYSDQTIQSFVGYGPIKNPRFVMLVKLDAPTNSRFAESSATPTFRNIAEFILNYYEVPPDRN